MEFNGHPYRAQLEVCFKKSGATVINILPLEDYVRGVVGREMGANSPEESLKAQAVIARTYAYANNSRHGKEGFAVCATTHCQVYGGVIAERPSINEAVDETKGVIMVSDGKPISTLYHATCGGWTSDNDKVFGGAPRSYLRRVRCPFCSHGHQFRWSRKIDVAQLQKKLGKEGVKFTKLFQAREVADSPMDRVKKVVFVTDEGVIAIKGTTLRRIFSLPSSTFVVKKDFSHTPLQSATNIPPWKLYQYPPNTNSLPNELVIQSANGVHRVIQAKQGWVILASPLNPEKPCSTEVGSTKMVALNSIDIFGRGYGHQVGLCQAGAVALGKLEWSYRQILPYYYSNVLLRRLDTNVPH